MVIMGRLLTDAEVASIGARAQTSVVLEAFRRDGDGPLPAAARIASGTDAVRVRDDVAQVRHTFDDIDGQPVLTLRVDLPRTITAGANTTIGYARAFTVGAALAVLLLMLFVLDREVLDPLSRVTKHASALGSGDDLAPRLDVHRRDEIGTLAHELDRMVGRLAESRRRLIDHSFESGRAELSRGILHNIGNAMTPLGVRVARLQERLRNAPIADLERALDELSREPVGTERHADLDAFVRLVATELADCVRLSEADVEVIARQGAAVQAALTDQTRSSRGGTVIEPVNLVSLVGQSLEIVPDNAREEIQLVLDPSLEATGTVRVARTVLRLVLQNLVINAAEATRAAGTARGAVRLSAELAAVGEGSELSIRCQDQGIGIDAADLARVFERGFSTKGDTGSRGIGLHWCATAVANLGGRIWATSEGRGLGATFHVCLPVPDPTPVPEPAIRAA
jgi:signal transduction histidine kinase